MLWCFSDLVELVTTPVGQVKGVRRESQRGEVLNRVCWLHLHRWLQRRAIMGKPGTQEGKKKKKGQPWGVRLAAVVCGLSLLVTLPWETLDHAFPYPAVDDVPDVGAQDKPR